MRDQVPDTGLLSGQSAVRMLTLGDVRLTYAVDGAMGLYPGAFFPDLPARYWAAHPEALDQRGRVAMSAGGLLVERGGRALLIDAGLGAMTGKISFGPVNSGSLLDTLAALGHDPAGIEAVAFTHLHIDHTGVGLRPGRRRGVPQGVSRGALSCGRRGVGTVRARGERARSVTGPGHRAVRHRAHTAGRR
jgi:Metallo-beta-lactamase superfamily